jgi:hypothetical protein
MKFPQLIKVGGCWSGFREQSMKEIVDLETARLEAVGQVAEGRVYGLIGPTLPVGGIDVARSGLCKAHVRQPVMFSRSLKGS